jgi:hypothetical protein
MAFGIDDAIAAGLKVLDKFIPDPEAKAKAEADLRSSLMDWDRSQNEVNTAEAANTNLFVAGWRPMIGWVCALALAYQYLLSPLSVWIATMLNHPIPFPPKLDDTLWQLMFGMLGMGGLRTYEKLKGVSK